MRLSTLSLAFQILTILFQGLQSHSSPCFTYLISETPKTSTCSNPLSFPTSTSPLNIPSPYKILALSFTIKPTSLCPTASDYLLLTVSIIPPGTSTRKRVMIIKFLPISNEIVLVSEDSSAEQSIYSTQSTFLDKPITIYMIVDLANSGSSGRAAIISENKFNSQTSSLVLNYGSDWIFDSSTIISVCSNYDGSPGVGCIVQNLKLMYKIPSQIITMPFGNINSRIGDYKFDEKKGTYVSNSQKGSGVLSPASLSSSSSPTWTLDTGLEFSENANGNIQIPNFIPSGQDLSVTTSVAFVFYMKIDEAPSANANLMSHYCNSITKDIWSLSITPSLRLSMTLNGFGGNPPQFLTLGKWTTIYLAFVLTAGGYGRGQLTIDGVVMTGSLITTDVSASLVFSNLDILKVGGAFSGHIKRIQIYSPGSLGVVTSSNYQCDSSICSMEIGFSNPPDCLKTTCTTPGLYSSLGTCEPCFAGCQACTNPGVCQSCNPKYYSVGTTCVECPKGKYVASSTSCEDCPPDCSSCKDAQTCTSCNPGLGLYQNTCIPCPTGTYLTSDQICKDLPKTLQDTLTNSQLTNSGATQVSNLISQGSSISLSAAVSGRIFSQIKYLNISYSGELQVALITWLPSFVSLGPTPNMPESLREAIPNRLVPYVFEKYEVPSSFLVNFWESLGVIVFVSIFWSLLKGFELVTNRQKNPRRASFTRKLRVIIQNFFITALFGVYGDLVMFSIIEYRTLVFGWNLSLLSWIISFVLLIAMFISFFIQVQLLINYQKLKNQDQSTRKLDKFRKVHEGSQVLFKDFKDYSLSPQLFLFFLSGRDLIFSLLLATMFEYPLAQTLIITILDCLMIAYLFIKRPFENIFDFAQQLFFEFIGLIVNVAVFINSILDTGKYEAIGARNNLGKLIIIANLIFNFVTAVFMLIAIVHILLDFYKRWKAKTSKKSKKLRDLRLQTRVQELPSIPQSKDTSSFELQSLNQGRMTSLNSEMISLQQESFDLNLLPHEIRPSKQLKRIKRPPRKQNNSLQNQESTNALVNLQYQEMASNHVTQQGRSVQRVNESRIKSLPKHNKRKED